MSLVVALSVVSEASILIFTFYWAPLLSSVFAESIEASSAAAAAVSGAVMTASSSAGLTPMGAAAAAVLEPGVAQAGAGAGGAAELVTAATRYLADAPSWSTDSSFSSSSSIPYMLIYATFMMSTMLGTCSRQTLSFHCLSTVCPLSVHCLSTVCL